MGGLHLPTLQGEGRDLASDFMIQRALQQAVTDVEAVLGRLPYTIRLVPGGNAFAVGGREIHVGAELIRHAASPFGFDLDGAALRAFTSGIVAHETGHLLAGDQRSTHEAEQRADAVAATVLGRLALDSEPLFLFLFGTRGSTTHPDGFDRAKSFLNIYGQARWFGC